MICKLFSVLFLISLVAFSVALPPKYIACNSQKDCPVISQDTGCLYLPNAVQGLCYRISSNGKIRNINFNE